MRAMIGIQVDVDLLLIDVGTLGPQLDLVGLPLDLYEVFQSTPAIEIP